MDPLSEEEIRILGALIEKQVTTPEYYPLTIKALTAACNQKSNRNPVMKLDDVMVEETLFHLRDKNLAWRVDGSRVSKYEHNLEKSFGFDQQEMAIMCELMLRGPQTYGELKVRGHRLYPFYKMIQVEAAVERLRDKEMLTTLPKAPGQKESRHAHLLAGTPQVAEPQTTSAASRSSSRLEVLENEVQELRAELASLSEDFASFKQQFD